jgi:hypothetical protein
MLQGILALDHSRKQGAGGIFRLTWLASHDFCWRIRKKNTPTKMTAF